LLFRVSELSIPLTFCEGSYTTGYQKGLPLKAIISHCSERPQDNEWVQVNFEREERGRGERGERVEEVYFPFVISKSTVFE